MDDFQHGNHRRQIAALYYIFQDSHLPASIADRNDSLWALLMGCPCLTLHYKAQLVQNIQNFSDEQANDFFAVLENQKQALFDAHMGYRELIEKLYIAISEGAVIDIYDLSGMQKHLPASHPEFPAIALDLRLHSIFHDTPLDSDEVASMSSMLVKIETDGLLTNSAAWLSAAHVQTLALKAPAAALKSCEMALKFDSDNDGAWFYLGRMLTLLDTQNIRAAEDAHRRCLTINPESTQCLHSLAELLYRRCDNRLDSASLCRQILVIDESHLAARRLLAEIQHTSGFLEDAEKLYRETILRHDDELAHHGLAVLCIQMRRFDEGRQALMETIRVSPDNAAAWNSLGHLLARYLGDDDGATKAFRRAAELHSDFASDLIAQENK